MRRGWQPGPKGVLISLGDTKQVDLADLKAMAKAGYVEPRGNDTFEVTEKGREFLAAQLAQQMYR